MSELKALIFDVDGTLAETEEQHRLAFNAAFHDAGLPYQWSVDRYRELLGVTGGKQRMAAFFAGIGDTTSPAAIAELHRAKNRIYAEAVADGQVRLRTGIARLLMEAREAGLRLAIATTTSRENLLALLHATMGSAHRIFEVMVTGEDVAVLKPDPEVYLKALTQLGLPAENCLAFEDSVVGLESATRAGLRTVVTPSLYTSHHRFGPAALVVSSLGEPGSPPRVCQGGLAPDTHVDLAVLRGLVG